MEAIITANPGQVESVVRATLIEKGVEVFVAAILAQAIADSETTGSKGRIAYFPESKKMAIKLSLKAEHVRSFTDAVEPLGFCCILNEYESTDFGFNLEYILHIRKLTERETQSLLSYLNFHWFKVVPRVTTQSIHSDAH